MLMFSTIDCGGDASIFSVDDVRSIMKIQDRYVELMWRYLRYRHGEDEAIRCLSNLIRSLFALIRAIDNASNADKYNEMIDTLIKQTETVSILVFD